MQQTKMNKKSLWGSQGGVKREFCLVEWGRSARTDDKMIAKVFTLAMAYGCRCLTLRNSLANKFVPD